MQIIASTPVDHIGADPRTLVLCAGNINDIPVEIDLQHLVIACTPGEYGPDGNPVVAELEQLGIQLAAVEKNFLLHDFRPSMPCWTSRRFTLSGANFRHLTVWEPVFAEDATTSLNDVHYAFQALNRMHGFAGGGSAMFMLWPGIGEDEQQDTFRMQFFSAMALAGRSAWETLYLLVPAQLSFMAEAWFQQLTAKYEDPFAAFLDDLSNRLLPLAASTAQTPRKAENDGLLTDRQFDAIYAYTDYSFALMRRALRRNDPRHAEFLQTQPLIEATSTALACLPNYAGERLIRAFDLPEYPQDYYRDGYETRELAYCSTSLLHLPYGDWYLYLYTSLGKDIARYSKYPTEYEILHDCAMNCVVTHMEAHDDQSKEGDVLAHERLPAYIGVRDTHL